MSLRMGLFEMEKEGGEPFQDGRLQRVVEGYDGVRNRCDTRGVTAPAPVLCRSYHLISCPIAQTCP